MKIKILTDTHSHQDKPVPKGEVIDVSDDDAKAMVALEVAEFITSKKKED